jgi:hypothetical protein
MSNDPEQAIIDILEHHHGISRSKLSPSSRLFHDLGVDGDDAAELFQRIRDKYGTDFTALDRQWRTFFGNEGLGLQALLMMTAIFIPAMAISVAVGVHFDLPRQATALMGVAIFFGLVWLLRKVCPKPRPVTIAGLAEIVRQGAWPRDPSLVS